MAGILGILVAICLIPYVFPLSHHAPSEKPPFENSGFMEIDGISHHYRVWRPRGDMTHKIVLIHGLFESTFTWERVIPLLTERGYAVLAVDLPGFGYSARFFRCRTDCAQYRCVRAPGCGDRCTGVHTRHLGGERYVDRSE